MSDFKDYLLQAAAIIWSLITGATNAVAGHGYMCDTTSAAITLTLPAAPSLGDSVYFTDAAGTFSTNNLTIAKNSLNIMGLAEDMTVSTNYARGGLAYSDATNGWRLI